MEQIQVLYQPGMKQMLETQIKEFNKIDQLMIQAKIEAEKKCQKFHAGEVPWTPVVMQAIYQILYWKGVKKQKTGRMICNMVLRHQTKQALRLIQMITNS